MGGPLRIGSCTFAFALGLFLLGFGGTGSAQLNFPDRMGPEEGRFDWTKFVGRYHLGECKSRPSAIWGDGPPGTFVQITLKVGYTRTPATDGLELIRANGNNPIALGWSVELIGQGPQVESDSVNGTVDKIAESYATSDGVYSMMAWNRPHNVGWSTLRLRMDSRGNVSLTIRQRTDSDASTREETCTLTRIVPKNST